MPFNQIRPIEDAITVTDKVKAKNGLPVKTIPDEPLIPAREDEVNKEAPDNAAQ